MWKNREFTIPSEVQPEVTAKYHCYYRSIVDCIAFLIGHRPFRRNIVYSPVREYEAENARSFHELHTADWWWDTQDRLPEGSTVVPIILASDKTLLTQHHGDQVAWPIYITIGNLVSETRRSPLRPSTLLLGFLPIPSQEFSSYKRPLYHLAMATILERKCLALLIFVCCIMKSLLIVR